MAPGVAAAPRRPVCSAAVEQYCWDRHQQQHKKRIERSKTTVNNKWSNEQEKKLQPSRGNAKKEVIKDMRFDEIERENARLLGRMYEINKRSSVNKAASNLVMAVAPARSASVPAGSRANARVRELQRIDAENQKLLKRLNGTKPSVNYNKFDQEHKAQQRLMRLRMESAAPEPRQRGRLPFDPLPPSAPQSPTGYGYHPDCVEDECDELQRLQERLRMQGDSPTPSTGSRAQPQDEEGPAWDAAEAELEEDLDGAEADAGAEPPRRVATPEMRYAGGIPKASQAMVDMLMAERFDALDAPDAGHSEEAVEYAREAAAQAMRAAACVDMHPIGELSYGDVVAQARRPAFGFPRTTDGYPA